jgi:tetratricopeptide (TPR) repeat protein
MLGTRIGELDAEGARTRPSSPEAAALYLEALGAWTRSFGVADDNRLALELAERAVALDPELAGARALLSQAKAAAASDWDLGNRAKNLHQARQHAERAIALDPQLPAARVAMVAVLMEEGRTEEASRAIEDAYRVAPEDPDVASFVASDRGYTRGLWRDALAIREQQLRRNPRDLTAFNQLLMTAMRAGKLERAQELCQGLAAWMPPPRPVADYWCALLPAWRSGDLGPLRALASDPPEDLVFYYGWAVVALAPAQVLGWLADPKFAARLAPHQAALTRGLAERRLGHTQEARRAFEDARALAHAAVSAAVGADLRVSMVTEARALSALGRGNEAMAVVPRLLTKVSKAQRHEWLPVISLVAIDAGRTEEAIDALDKSLSAFPLWTTPAFLRVDPRFEALHGDPRFEAMLARHAKLPELPDP